MYLYKFIFIKFIAKGGFLVTYIHFDHPGIFVTSILVTYRRELW